MKISKIPEFYMWHLPEKYYFPDFFLGGGAISPALDLLRLYI